MSHEVKHPSRFTCDDVTGSDVGFDALQEALKPLWKYMGG